MPADTDARAFDQALDWVRRIQDPGFADWEAHMLWLEADPRHADRMDEALLLIEEGSVALAPTRPMPNVAVFPARGAARVAAPANDNPRSERAAPRRGRGYLGAGAIAAALVAAVTLMPSRGGGAGALVQTGPGEQRSLTLADGTRVALNGDSAIRLGGSDPRAVSLERGQAFFTVVHDAARPFTVRAGDAEFRDVGTAFDLVRTSQRTALAVRQGAVDYDPEGQPVRVAAGQALDVRGERAVLRTVEADQPGGWTRGRLSYRDAPMDEVAQEIARTIGAPVSVDPRLASARFTGVVAVEGNRRRMFRRFAAVAGIAAEPEGRGWRLTPPAR